MRRHRATTAFSIFIAALFLAALLIQPRSAQFKLPDDQPSGGAATEGQGFTKDPNKIESKEEIEFLQDQSFDKLDFESGLAAPEEEGGTATPDQQTGEVGRWFEQGTSMTKESLINDGHPKA